MANIVRAPSLQRLTAATLTPSRPFIQPHTRCFSLLKRPTPSYEGHIPLTVVERLSLAFGSGIGSFVDPRRGGKYMPRLQMGFDTNTSRPHRILW
jgi:ubiquinone biosynthesis protein COQ4